MTTEKLNSKEYPAITLETLERTAVAAAWVAVNAQLRGKARKVTDGKGNVLDHDGNNGGNETMRRLYNGFAYGIATMRGKMAECADEYESNPTKDTLATLLESMDNYTATTANDTDDCISVARLSLWESIVNNGGAEADEEAFNRACNAVRCHIHAEDSNTATRIRRKYDENGNLLAIDDYQYIKYPHLYIDEYSGTDENGNPRFDIVDVNDELSKYIRGQMDNDTINEALALLTTTQRRIVHMVARGYTQETIAKRLNMTDRTVRNHLARIREKVAHIEH